MQELRDRCEAFVVEHRVLFESGDKCVLVEMVSGAFRLTACEALCDTQLELDRYAVERAKRMRESSLSATSFRDLEYGL